MKFYIKKKSLTNGWLYNYVRTKNLDFFSRVDALCAEYLTKCHIKKLDAEILSLVMNQLPNELKYHLSMLEGSGDGLRSWEWIKKKIVYFVEKFPHFLNHNQQFLPRYPPRRPVTNMAEAVNIECFYCRETGHSIRDCPIRKVDLEAKGLNIDQVNEENRQRLLAKKSSRGFGHGGGTKW